MAKIPLTCSWSIHSREFFHLCKVLRMSPHFADTELWRNKSNSRFLHSSNEISSFFLNFEKHFNCFIAIDIKCALRKILLLIYKFLIWPLVLKIWCFESYSSVHHWVSRSLSKKWIQCVSGVSVGRNWIFISPKPKLCRWRHQNQQTRTSRSIATATKRHKRFPHFNNNLTVTPIHLISTNLIHVN